MRDADAYQCTLPSDEVPGRMAQIRRLTHGLQSRTRADGVVHLEFAADLVDEVHEFVGDESRCCSFYEFVVEERDGAVHLTVRAPAAAQALLDGLHAVFEPEAHTPD